MIAVIFEVESRSEGRDAYLHLASQLKPIVERIDGFLGIERFESLSTPGKLLALSWWENEEAVRAWREMPEHRVAQQAGRQRLFANYRLRIAHVVRDYSMTEREHAPAVGDSPRNSAQQE